MTSVHREVRTAVVTHIVATEARLVCVDDVLIHENEAWFVRSASFVDEGRIVIILDGHPALTLGRHEPILVVRVKIHSAETPH